jgi:hypothetical protein
MSCSYFLSFYLLTTQTASKEKPRDKNMTLCQKYFIKYVSYGSQKNQSDIIILSE